MLTNIDELLKVFFFPFFSPHFPIKIGWQGDDLKFVCCMLIAWMEIYRQQNYSKALWGSESTWFINTSMLHNVFLDGKCQIYNTVFPQAHTVLKAVDSCFYRTIFFKTFKLVFVLQTYIKWSLWAYICQEKNM